MTCATSRGVLIVALVTLLACSAPPRSEVTAPDFNAISDEQLESSMWRLAAGVREIHAIFRSEQPVRRSQQAELLRILDEMIAAAEELGPEGVATNHARITENLGRFREKLVIARSAVAENPPSYLLVPNIASTCLACHRSD